MKNNKGVYMNQRDATTSTLLAILEERGVSYELDGETPISEVLNSEDKAKARDALFTMFRNEQIDFKDKSKLADDKYLRDYISGLVNNWIRKAPEFNGGDTYQAKNPGSRQGSQDDMIKEMKKLLSVTTDQEAKEAIQEAIAQRQAEIKPSKVEINVNSLPEHLRHLVK